MRRLILSLLVLALVAIPVSVALAPPDPGTLAPVHGARHDIRFYETYADPLSDDTFIGLRSGAGVLALRGSPPTEFRVYATYENPLSNAYVTPLALGWRLVVNDAEAGTITLNFGASQTVTTSTVQDAALTRLLAKINAERVAASQPPFATIEDWLKATLVGAVQSYREQAAKADAEDACVAYAAASTAAQNAIKAALGGKSPCP